jgi:DnaK suppressor protein
MAIDTGKYKTMLEEEKAKLEKELSGLGRTLNDDGDWMATPGEQPGPLDNDDPDKNVQADYVEEFEERVSTLSTLEERYAQLVAALGRIADGTYGTCRVSGQPIEEERLDANPAAETCIAHMNE